MLYKTQFTWENKENEEVIYKQKEKPNKKWYIKQFFEKLELILFNSVRKK